MNKLLIISGRSGSGKSSALNILEDLGYFCIDNLPLTLLPSLIQHFRNTPHVNRIGVGVDVRSQPDDLGQYDQVLEQLQGLGIQTDTLFLDARDDVLLARFSATRRRHPLSTDVISLSEAIEQEKRILDPIASRASVYLDTSNMNVHELQHTLSARLANTSQVTVLFESFGYKHGVPLDADFVFDVRCLPNPHWQASLRELTGQDVAVQSFLEGHAEVEALFHDISTFLLKWLPRITTDHRHYLTVAIGCTGGQHRSVYIVERLTCYMAGKVSNIQTLHRELIRKR